MMGYSELLKSYIEKSGKTLMQISIELKDHGFNISKGYISQLQNGKTERPATDELTRALALVTGGNINELLTASLIEKAPVEIKEKIIRLQQLKDLKKRCSNPIDALQVAEASTDYNVDSKFKSIPLLGSIAAGQPIDMIEQFEDVEFVDRSTVRGNDAFALKVKGDSMIGDMIVEGDIVICIVQEEVTANEIAVVSVDGESATLKRVKIQDNMCMLIPSNPKMQPILIPTQQVHILGKVIEVRRRF